MSSNIGHRAKRIFLFSFFSALTIIALIGCRSGTRAPAPGETASNFAAPDLAGGAHSLQEFKGKVILLNFWASWCAPCREEMPQLEVLYQALKSEGFLVIGVGVEDSPQDLATIVKETGVTFPVLLDPKGEIKSSFGITGLPESYVLDRNGKFVYTADPATLAPVLKIVGARQWAERQSVEIFRSLLRK